MSLPLFLLLAAPGMLSSPAHATGTGISSVQDGIVIRPDTYVVDTRFTTGDVENFIELYLDPATVKTVVQPASLPQVPMDRAGAMHTAPSFPPTGDLVLVNERMSKNVVSVSGTRIGLVQPLTEAILHDVKTGCYEVSWALPDDATYTEQLCTVAQARAPFPGGPTAAVYLEQGRPDRDEPEWRFGPPDLDKDGITDADDECPTEAGPESSFGCPDGDQDRVPDYRDKCPEQKAPARADARRSDGCPARVFVAAQSIEITEKIFFQTNKAKIKSESFGLLDEIAGILKSHEEIKRVEVAGHTDAQGNDASNLKLSDGRAAAVVDYLVRAGVAAERLQAKGYGETQPIDSNETDEGRAMNRRVEFRILEQDKRMVPARTGRGAEGEEAAPMPTGEAAPMPTGEAAPMPTGEAAPMPTGEAPADQALPQPQ